MATGLAMIHLTTKYLLPSAMVGGCSVAFTLRAIKTAKDRRDSNRIYVFLCRNFENGQYRFQTSEAISVVTNLSVSRVAKLCGKTFSDVKEVLGSPISLWKRRRAGEGNRTLVCSLGSCRSAIELHPQLNFRFSIADVRFATRKNHCHEITSSS